MSEKLDNGVSVCMITYNHGEFIAQAIESVLMQKVNFQIELIIGDDCSSDNTRQICMDYQAKYPKIIKLRLPAKNQGAIVNVVGNLNLCKLKYIAMLEGDDYWTDPCKLQKQVDFLEANTHIVGCFHDVINVDENNIVLKENFYESHQKIYKQSDCVRMGGAYATCSLVFRSIAIKNIPEWALKGMSDYVLDLLITEYGDIAHIGENMGAYRIHRGGAWQGNKLHKNLEETVRRYRICLTVPKFKRKYGSHFNKLISEFSLQISKEYGWEDKWFKQLKYAWYYFYYLEAKNKQSLKFLIRAILASPYIKRIKRYFKYFHL